MANVKKRQNPQKKVRIDNEVQLYLYALVVITLSLIAILQLGVVGAIFSGVMRYLVGELYAVVYALIAGVGVMLLFRRKIPNWASRTALSLSGLLLAWLLLSAIPKNPNLIGFDAFSLYLNDTAEIIKGEIAYNGGLIGTFLYSLSSLLVARMGTYIVIIVLFVLSALLLFDQKKYREWFGKLFTFVKMPKHLPKAPAVKKIKAEKEIVKPQSSVFDWQWNDEEDDLDTSPPRTLVDVDLDIESNQIKEEALPMQAEPAKKAPKIKVEQMAIAFETPSESALLYDLPKMSLLDSSANKGMSKANQQNAKANGAKVVEILKQFGIHCTLENTHIGPSVTKFEIKPEMGVRVSRIASLQDDIKMALAAKDIRIEAPIPGRSAVGIEIPNVESTTVKLHEMLLNIPPKVANKKLLVTLGKDIMGQPIYGELDRMPHLLVAGATGSGKSVCMNAIITSLLMRATPEEVKLVLVDPKRVEFTAYHHLPHLLTPVINDAKEAANGLKIVVQMMEGRYELFAESGVRNIGSYNDKIAANEFHDSRKPLPYIVVIIDELADLMMAAAKEVEASIQRITQLARAAGIHLIVATQRPSVDVITGIIKANIPSRIAFAVSSSVDSRTILDSVGAERLLGQGDMLYIPIGEPSAVRIQGVYVSDDEVARICDFVKSQAKPVYDKTFQSPSCPDGEGAIGTSSDALYQEAKDFVVLSQKASTSLLQRRFGIGYNRAARLIDILEENSIIGPNAGSKPREVYVKEIKEDDEND